MRKHYRALWDRTVKVMTPLVFILLGSLLFMAEGFWRYPLLALVVGLLFFIIRGYSVFEGKLHIHRLGWANTFDLARLDSIFYESNTTLGSIRVFGNGGVGGYIGWYQNSVLGRYRSYATNQKDTVVLQFGESKVVVSPEDPEEFVKVVQQARDAVGQGSRDVS